MLISPDVGNNVKIHLEQPVTNQKFYIQARTVGGSTAHKEIDVTVIPFKCQAIEFITTINNADPEIFSIDKDGDATITRSEAEVKAWFKIDEKETSKKADCWDL